MADVANVRGDLMKLLIGGTEFYASKITLTGVVGGFNYVKPTSIGQVIGATQGEFDLRIKANLIETSAAVVRSVLGFDSGGVDFNRKAGTAIPTVDVRVADPQDTENLRTFVLPRAMLIDASIDSDGEGNQELSIEFRAISNAAGELASIGPAA